MRNNPEAGAPLMTTASSSACVGGHNHSIERSSHNNHREARIEGARLQPCHYSRQSQAASAAEVRPKALAYLLGLALLTGCSNTTPPKPLAQLTPHETSGYRVFQAHCAACHYDRQSDPLHGPPLRAVFQKKYLPSGAPANDDRVTATVQHGRGMMPAQPNLDPEDLNDLLAYLHTL